MKIINSSLVSIIIPIFNVSNFLREAIDSICNQTYTNLEIILVNDGSTDDSLRICNEYKQLNKRIKVIHKENGGLSSARNAGIEIATGDYIFFLDGDDFIETDTIESLLSSFSLKENLGIVSAPCFYSYYEGNRYIYKEEWNIKQNRIISYHEFCIATLLQKSCHSACCKLYKKELFNNLCFRIGKRNEDTLFMFDLSKIMEEKKLDMLEIPNRFYYYRTNEGSITRNSFNPIQIDIIENLHTLISETNSFRVLKTLKELFYKESFSFYSILLLDAKVKKRIEVDKLDRFFKIFQNICISDVIKYTSIKNTIKYFVLKYFSSLYVALKM